MLHGLTNGRVTTADGHGVDTDISQTDSLRHDPFRMPADAVRRNITPTPANTGIPPRVSTDTKQLTNSAT
jgi:hypothetical protein